MIQLSNLALKHLVEELQILKNGFVNKIQTLDNGWIKIKVHTKEGGKDLVLAPNALFVADYSIPAKMNPGGYSAFLKKYLFNQRVISIEQKGVDRIVVLEFPDYFLIVELFAKGNVILVDRNMKIAKAFKKDEDIGIKTKLRENYNLEMPVPSAYFIGKKDTDFIWLRKETNEFNHEVLIYSYPYTDTMSFSPEYIMSYRNEITEKYIPGQAKGSYMIVSEAYPPYFKVLNINGHYVVETRGLWKVHGDFMGGPFLSYTYLDEINNRIVTFDGSVYYPNKDMRDHVRQLEAMFYTVKFLKKKKPE